MNNLLSDEIGSLAAGLCALIEALPLGERIEALNSVRLALHQVSPFRSEPVDCVLWVPGETVEGNAYNPNSVAPPEMRLLEHSVRHDGFTQPIVGFAVPEGVEVIDGFHRRRVGRERLDIRTRLHGHLPVAIIREGNTALRDRVAATIRHNRARGEHGVIPMADIVANLLREGWDDNEVAKELGMDADEVLRFKQTTGLPGLFKNKEYSRAWE